MTVHALFDGDTLCGREPAEEEVTTNWPAVTCGDCQMASESLDSDEYDRTQWAEADREARIHGEY